MYFRTVQWQVLALDPRRQVTQSAALSYVTNPPRQTPPSRVAATLVRWESDLVEMTSFWDTGINVLPSCASVPPLELLINIFVFPRVDAKFRWYKAPRHFLLLDAHFLSHEK
jgi:hypothetical protein